jgi:hypothetical protein
MLIWPFLTPAALDGKGKKAGKPPSHEWLYAPDTILVPSQA